jgi:hypothetical protein
MISTVHTMDQGSAIQCPDGNCPPQWNQPTPATPPPFGSNLPVPPPTDLEPLNSGFQKLNRQLKNLESKYDSLDSRIVSLKIVVLNARNQL